MSGNIGRYIKWIIFYEGDIWVKIFISPPSPEPLFDCGGKPADVTVPAWCYEVILLANHSTPRRHSSYLRVLSSNLGSTPYPPAPSSSLSSAPPSVSINVPFKYLHSFFFFIGGKERTVEASLLKCNFLLTFNVQPLPIFENGCVVVLSKCFYFSEGGICTFATCNA